MQWFWFVSPWNTHRQLLTGYVISSAKKNYTTDVFQPSLQNSSRLVAFRGKARGFREGVSECVGNLGALLSDFLKKSNVAICLFHQAEDSPLITVAVEYVLYNGYMTGLYPSRGGLGYPNFVIGFVKILPAAMDKSVQFEPQNSPALTPGSKHRVNLWQLRKQQTVDINRRNM